MLIVFTTVAERSDAEALAEKIITSGLAGCVQILPRMTSIYKWEGELQKESEHLLLIKTTTEAWPSLEQYLNANHPYEVPEIVAIESDKVTDRYREWLESIVVPTPLKN